MNALDILDQLEAAKGPKAKGAILLANNSNKELNELLDAAMNFDRRFYVKKFSVPSPDQISLSHHDFMQLLNSLETRTVTGNDAIEAIESFLSNCDAQTQKWYTRVIRKDLRCDFGVSLANKNGFNLHEFEVMLAKDGKECKQLDKLVNAGVYASPKFNGYRALAICDHGEVILMSRNGLPYTNFSGITEELQKLSANSKFILDGEMMSDDFNAMQQTAMSSKSKKSVGDMKYHVFGWISWDEWETKDFIENTDVRLMKRDAWFEEHKPTLMVKVDHTLMYSVADALEYEKECILNKYEGAMLLPNIPYYLGKKSNKLLKLKTFQSMDCEIIDFYEGKADKRLEGTMGGVIVRQENGKTCEIGSGWNDKDRDEIWNNKDKYLGRFIEVQYQELSPYDIMLFPTFQRFRTDKDE